MGGSGSPSSGAESLATSRDSNGLPLDAARGGDRLEWEAMQSQPGREGLRSCLPVSTRWVRNPRGPEGEGASPCQVPAHARGVRSMRLLGCDSHNNPKRRCLRNPGAKGQGHRIERPMRPMQRPRLRFPPGEEPPLSSLGFSIPRPCSAELWPDKVGVARGFRGPTNSHRCSSKHGGPHVLRVQRLQTPLSAPLFTHLWLTVGT